MKLEEIHSIVAEYSKLYTHAESLIYKLSELDSKGYRTGNRITEIEISETVTFVTCDDSYRGYVDSTSFQFPTVWLTLTDEEIEKEVQSAKIKREQYIKDQEEQKKKRELLEKEERERKEFERLKKKFG